MHARMNLSGWYCLTSLKTDGEILSVLNLIIPYKTVRRTTHRRES